MMGSYNCTQLQQWLEKRKNLGIMGKHKVFLMDPESIRGQRATSRKHTLTNTHKLHVPRKTRGSQMVTTIQSLTMNNQLTELCSNYSWSHVRINRESHGWGTSSAQLYCNTVLADTARLLRSSCNLFSLGHVEGFSHHAPGPKVGNEGWYYNSNPCGLHHLLEWNTLQMLSN